MIKHILSLPQSTPDTVLYVLSGVIPIEGQLHIKALTFKDYKSSSWFIEMKKIIWKYNLPDTNCWIDLIQKCNGNR